jgi:hypothetical protein
MQWHRHDYVKLASSETLIVKRCPEPACHEVSQMNLTAVLKIMDDLSDDTAAAVRGDCCIKVNCAMSTVGACERGRNRAFEGLGALLTKRRNNAHSLSFALPAEIFAGSSLAAAERAYWRVKKRHGRFK